MGWLGGCSAEGITSSQLDANLNSVGVTDPNASAQPAPAAIKPLLTTLRRVIDQDFPDPGILVDNGITYAFATNTGGKNVPVQQSSDLVNWLPAQEALPNRPSWAAQSAGFIWAPDMLKLGPQDFRMYVSAKDTASNLMCIAVAKASKPAGPYTPVGSTPLTCGFSTQGTLDASVMRTADNILYLVYKTNGDGDPSAYQIYGRQLAADGLSFTGPEVSLLHPSQNWDGNLLEGPNLAQRHGIFFLTYSCNRFNTQNYAVGLSTASNLNGPYSQQIKPLVSSGLNGLIGPGGQTAFVGPDGVDYFALHGWDSGLFRYRAMYIAPATYLAQNANLPRSY